MAGKQDGLYLAWRCLSRDFRIENSDYFFGFGFSSASLWVDITDIKYPGTRIVIVGRVLLYCVLSMYTYLAKEGERDVSILV
jgi:hypothetical protein